MSDLEVARKNILAALELSEEELHAHGDLFRQFKSLEVSKKLALAFDISLIQGQAGQWEQALEWIEFLQKHSAIEEKQAIWKLKCLVELAKYSESLALVDSWPWTQKSIKEVNLLAAQSFEGLGMHEQAKARIFGTKT